PSCRSSHQRPRFRSPSASHAHLIPPPTRRSSDLSSKATSIATENAGTSAETPGLANANSHVQIEAYWLERKKYLQELKNIPELKDRKSTRLNSSHVKISYAVFCLKKKKTTRRQQS